jgi:hypothetical protein
MVVEKADDEAQGGEPPRCLLNVEVPEILRLAVKQGSLILKCLANMS